MLETHGVLVPRLLLENAVPLKQVLENEVIWGHLVGRLKLLGGCLDKQLLVGSSFQLLGGGKVKNSY
jgi:hypothetical protein